MKPINSPKFLEKKSLNDGKAIEDKQFERWNHKTAIKKIKKNENNDPSPKKQNKKCDSMRYCS